MLKYWFVFLLIFLYSCAGKVKEYNPIHHNLSVTINPAENFIEARDTVTISADQLKSFPHFLLHSNLTVSSETPGITITQEESEIKAKDFGMDKEDFELSSDISQTKYSVHLADQAQGDVTLILKFSGKINHPIKNISEEYARGFSQTPGIICEKGVYLGGSTYWTPWFNDNLITFNLTTVCPETWDVVSQGKRALHEIKDNQRHVRWESPEPMDEVFLIAAEFTEYKRSVGAVTAMAFLRTADENMANKYLETTAQYLEMYRQLIGPFPYSKFALIENFWETGYGMPSFTLLGPRIIRFPFILHSSYPHELLHNWWGNSVFVDYSEGNWCEGSTVYMADHLIKEQRGQGAEYRRSSLQGYTDYVNENNDFPLAEFISRTNAATSAVGYSKAMMVWNMMREDIGDDLFIKGVQTFYRDNKFKRASYDNIRQAFESAADQDFKPFFDQWVKRTGAPELRLSDVKVDSEKDGWRLYFKLSQIQPDDAYHLNIPIAVYLKDEAKIQKVEMTQKEQTYQLTFPHRPLRIDVDPQFNLFRRLHYNEIPPSLSKILGAKEILILLPSKADTKRIDSYKQLAEKWSKGKSSKIEIRLDNEFKEMPADKMVWVFGWDNLHSSLIEKGIENYDAEISDKSVRFSNTIVKKENNSFVISVRHPKDPNSVLVWLAAGVDEAMPGLARKLPHYGKYSYLAFEGAEPSNIAKGQWPAVHSPLTALIPAAKGYMPEKINAVLPKRKALAMLNPVFSADRMLDHVKYLAGEELEGRGLGSAGIDKAAEYIAEQFKKAGLQPGGDNNTYFQNWRETADEDNKMVDVKNVIGVLPGSKKEWADQSVVVCAHYDHLGRGWPDVRKGNEGKIHFGADDNASGVGVIIELANLLGKTMKPDRTIIFVAFTSEESGLRGSKYYVKNMKLYPAKKVIGALNLDTVGRLFNNKIMVFNGASAKEWKFIFMGAGYVTGIESEIVTMPLDASDQISFINAGIPAVQFFSGAHRDYHRPSDTVDKIDADGMVKVAAFVREAIVYLAEREEPLTFLGKEKKESKLTEKKDERKVGTGAMPDFTYSGKGVRIANLSQDSPAAKAGMKKGDVIIKLDKYQIGNLSEYTNALKKYKPGDVVKIIYIRGDETNSTKIKLGER
jgi:hypothetical protein